MFIYLLQLELNMVKIVASFLPKDNGNEVRNNYLFVRICRELRAENANYITNSEVGLI